MSAIRLCFATAFGLVLAYGAVLHAQEEPPATAPAVESSPPELQDRAGQALEDAKRKAEQLAVDVDKSREAQQITAGILQPIYQLAEKLSFPMFHWLAFAVMATGVVSYALQLVLAKLVVLTRMGFSPAEILSDVLGLVISVMGLVLTTQAAAENSTFTQSPASVLSASAVGLVCGFVFYRWGQAQEVQATLARRQVTGAAARK
jgi:hypothetical protein